MTKTNTSIPTFYCDHPCTYFDHHLLFYFFSLTDSPVDVETGPSSPVEQVKGNNQASRHSRDTSGNIHGVLRIIVTDDGAGISAINQSRLFHEVRC